MHIYTLNNILRKKLTDIMASNTNIDALPGGHVFSYYFLSANRCAVNFFLKHLRVKASSVSTGVSLHNFRAKYVKPVLHVLHLVLGFEDHGNSLFHILSGLILTQIYPKDLQGLTCL